MILTENSLRERADAYVRARIVAEGTERGLRRRRALREVIKAADELAMAALGDR